MKRDPRMVERKKTGMAKARKRVSLLVSLTYFLRSLTAFLSILGSNVDPRPAPYLSFSPSRSGICLFRIIVPRCTSFAREVVTL